MTRTQHNQALAAATATFDRMTEDERWLGWGYLGGRQTYLDDLGSASLVADTDAALLDLMSTWTDDERFAWANSKLGRWTADEVFGGGSFHNVVAWDLVRKVEDDRWVSRGGAA